jgi:hypothetical protein
MIKQQQTYAYFLKYNLRQDSFKEIKCFKYFVDSVNEIICFFKKISVEAFQYS